LVIVNLAVMQLLTVSKAKAGFSGLARQIIKKRETVVVRTPHGFIQMAPYDLPEVVSPAPRGSVRHLPQALEMINTFGESL
jgi:hypothetical protein